MRYRFSLWDLFAVLLTALGVSGAYWLQGRMSGPVPLHWGPAGTPDRFGQPTLISFS